MKTTELLRYKRVRPHCRVSPELRRFLRDVMIDMYGYRRHGHNESDEPALTQPLMYAAIAERKSVRDGYLEHLLKLGGMTVSEADRIAVERRKHLEAELGEARRKDYKKTQDSQYSIATTSRSISPSGRCTVTTSPTLRFMSAMPRGD